MAEAKSNAAGKKRNAALEAMGQEAPAAAAAATPPPERPQKPAKAVAKVMLYVHPKVARKMKEIAFTEDRKANDVYLDAVDHYLKHVGQRGSKYVIEH